MSLLKHRVQPTSHSRARTAAQARKKTEAMQKKNFITTELLARGALAGQPRPPCSPRGGVTPRTTDRAVASGPPHADTTTHPTAMAKRPATTPCHPPIRNTTPLG